MHLKAYIAFSTETPDPCPAGSGHRAPAADVLKSMKQLRGDTPVIIVPGRTHISDAIEAFKAGAWDYVTKPIPSLAVFTNTLRNCLDQSAFMLGSKPGASVPPCPESAGDYFHHQPQPGDLNFKSNRRADPRVRPRNS